MINLILTMIVAYEDFGNQLNFNKDDINNLIKKYNIINKLVNPEKPKGSIFTDKLNCNERAWIILYENDYITTEQLTKHLGMVYEDKNFWMVFDNFKDVLDNKEYDTEIQILNGDFDFNLYSSDFYDNYDISSVWGDYTEDTLKVIIDTCINNGIEIDEEEEVYFFRFY